MPKIKLLNSPYQERFNRKIKELRRENHYFKNPNENEELFKRKKIVFKEPLRTKIEKKSEIEELSKKIGKYLLEKERLSRLLKENKDINRINRIQERIKKINEQIKILKERLEALKF